MTADDRLIVALDVPNALEGHALVSHSAEISGGAGRQAIAGGIFVDTRQAKDISGYGLAGWIGLVKSRGTCRPGRTGLGQETCQYC